MGGFDDVRDWLPRLEGHIARRTDGKNETNEVPHKLASANPSRTAKTIATTKICDELMPTGACKCPYLTKLVQYPSNKHHGSNQGLGCYWG